MEDTICAIATPYGEGGVGMIRISGEAAEAVLSRIFRSAAKKGLENRKMTFGKIVDPADGSVVDEVLCVLMRAPATYTTEDVAEIYCHGGVMPLKKTLDLCIAAGARIAEPGEFTKRAFMGGRIDLSQAEAVMDVVSAGTERSHQVALDQLEGSLSSAIREIRSDLTDILVDLTVNIDYPDEDIEEITYEKLSKALASPAEKILELIKSSDSGRMLKDGLKIAIAGKPNVGKSSVMNAMLRKSRAIVTDIPGTTRDTIEESLDIRGIPVILTDTAGIRDTLDEIESIGIEKTKESLLDADTVFWVVDASSTLDDEDKVIGEKLKGLDVLCVLNKCDLGITLDRAEIKEILPSAEIVDISALQSTGIDKIEDHIEKKVFEGTSLRRESTIVTNARHKALLEEADRSMRDAARSTEDRAPLELIEIDVNEAYLSLGRIIGEEVEGDVLNEVFARFCLGK